ncbi:MAG: 50S ribosomal protein L10 [Campylobacterales bacterium]|jgi:large subunit ribosomal protein L10
MRKARKKEIIEQLTQEFTKDMSIFFADYKGQTVQQLEELRKTIREAGGKARVAKNTLARIAFANNGVEVELEDNNIFVWGEDQITLAKILVKHATTYKNSFKIKGAVIEGEPQPAEYVIEVSKLPTRDELLGMVAFMMKAPVAKFAWGLTKLIEKREAEGAQ